MRKRTLEPNIVLNNAKFYVEGIGKTKYFDNIEFYLVIILSTSPNVTAPNIFFSNAHKLEKPEIKTSSNVP